MAKNILLTILIILLVLIQISFFYQFDFFRSYLNLILVLVVFVTATIGYKQGVAFALIAGMTMDLYSPFTFGINSLALLLPVILIYSTFRTLLARKSLYSLLLVTIMGTVVYHVVLWSLTSLFFWLGWRDIGSSFSTEYVPLVVGQLVTHVMVMIILFVASRLIGTRITSRFLFSERV